MNVLNATWDLQLNRPYDDGGSENSSRVFGPAGWDYAPPIGGPRTLHAAAFAYGTVNDPAVGTTAWSVEVALPLAKLMENTPAGAPRAGGFWRINFSRVEWATVVVDGKYQKQPSCQSCPVPGTAVEDNWVWSPQGLIEMHLPERWGMLQFASGAVNATPAVRNAEWPVRAIAAATYYAEHAYAAAHNGTFTAAVRDLYPFLEDPAIVDGTCTGGAPVSVALAAGGFVATVDSARFTASIDDARFLQVGAN